VQRRVVVVFVWVQVNFFGFLAIVELLLFLFGTGSDVVIG
jgi:hypothetical protein